MDELRVATPVGTARLDWFPAPGRVKAVVVLGHGTATGVEAGDLQALARVLPPLGLTVVLVTQPYRVEGNPSVSDEASLDRAWGAIWPSVSGPGVPVVAGGRSAGSQVACRTARSLGAHSVLAMAYPLLGPGSPAELLATGKPTLVVQGGRDPFGRPEQFPKPAARYRTRRDPRSEPHVRAVRLSRPARATGTGHRGRERVVRSTPRLGWARRSPALRFGSDPGSR